MIGLKIYNIFSPQIYNLFTLVRVLLILINRRSIQGAHAFFLGIVIKCQDAAGFNRDQNSGCGFSLQVVRMLVDELEAKTVRVQPTRWERLAHPFQGYFYVVP